MDKPTCILLTVYGKMKDVCSRVLGCKNPQCSMVVYKRRGSFITEFNATVNVICSGFCRSIPEGRDLQKKWELTGVPQNRLDEVMIGKSTASSQHVVFELMNFSLLTVYIEVHKLRLFIWIKIRIVTELNLKIWHLWNKVI